MWFHSFAFWIFFAVVALGCRLLKHRGQNRLLLLASWFFYACWDWRFLSLILITTTVDFLAARRIAASEDPRTRRRWVAFSLVTDLGILGFFKYFGFFVAEFERLLASLGLEGFRSGLEIVLPVGISFYTFQALSYTIDVYRGHTRPARRFLDFALYIAFFPQLVAGPIERSSHLLPQVERPRPRLDEARFREGLYLVLTGLFRKIVIADNMAWLANYAFSRPSGELGATEVVVGVLAFAFQIYGDFSGYSAIAIGVAKWLGFDLMENFRQPYFAIHPRDFWSRWHISLSTWLRDYLYIPLGGNRSGKVRTAINLMVTMLLGGLWHGAAWTFLIWGGIHGAWLVMHRFLSGRRPEGDRSTSRPGPLRTGISLAGTFSLVCLTWLFFRAESLAQALGMLGALGGSWDLSPYAATGLSLIGFFVGPWLLFEAWIERRGDALAMTRVDWPWRTVFYLYLGFMMVFFPAPEAVEFLYFQF